MEGPDPSYRRRLLLDSLTALAADASAQSAWLERHGVAPDEIALDFDHAFRLAERLAEEGLLGRGVLPDLHRIDLVFSEMSGEGHADRWTEDALSTDQGWHRARQLARRVLVAEFGGWSPSGALPEIDVIR